MLKLGTVAALPGRHDPALWVLKSGIGWPKIRVACASVAHGLRLQFDSHPLS